MDNLPEQYTDDPSQICGGVGESTTSNKNVTDQRNLRLTYLNFKDSIMKNGQIKEDYEEFAKKITEVENLYRQVKRPREQLTDTETLLKITQSLCSYLKFYENAEGALLSDFISGLLEKYNDEGVSETCKSISWKDMGYDTSSLFRRVPGMPTMFGPMDTKLIQRKSVAQKKRPRLMDICCPNEMEETPGDADTEKNVVTMFNILKQRKCVQLEKLVCNRLSFSQTVENIFALSFLVKDGRVEITVSDAGGLSVAPRNAPGAKDIASGAVSYYHFVLRLDYKDWKLMLGRVQMGEEVMPHRTTRTDN